MMKPVLEHLAVFGIAAIFLAGCAVGPNFHPPKLQTGESYTASPTGTRTVTAQSSGGAAQHFNFGEQIAAQWWKLFHSESLDSLVRKGLAESPTVSAAQAALREAQENLRAARGALLLPGADAGFNVNRERISGATFGGQSLEFTLYNASVNVSYTLDLFGGARRQLEGLQAQVDYQRYQIEAAHLTLAANIVTTAIREASLRAQIGATHDMLASEEQALQLVERQFQLGAVPKSSVLAQQSEVAKTRATIPPLEKQLAITRHALAVLIGQLPSTGSLPEFNLDSLQLPEELPVSLPSTLAQQRPDVRASEALLHQASAQVGVATANLYPNITLTGSYGFESLAIDSLFSPGSVVWGIGAGILQPLFHGGELIAKRRAAVAAFDQAAAQYRQTVLTAFQNVADVLRALETDARALQAQAQAEAAAKATLDLTTTQFDLGAIDYLSLLVAQRDYQQARLSLITAEADRYSDTAALFQALGGGWWGMEIGDRGAVNR
jgi:NodT family efflux transporter outer membrane factor (OMF) lipoprotein